MWTRRAVVHPGTRLKIYNRDGWTCWLCGIEVSDAQKTPKRRRATLDHLLHRKDDGPNDPHNLRTCCHQCNQHRADSKATFSRTWRRSKLRPQTITLRRHREDQITTYLRCLVVLREWQVISETAFGARIMYQETKGWEDHNLTQEEMRQRSRFCLNAADKIQDIFEMHFPNTDPRLYIAPQLKGHALCQA